MKSKSTIKIVETPIIDNYDFQEHNGVINPAFLDAKSNAEEQDKGEEPPVEKDYRQNHFKTSPQTPHKQFHSLDRPTYGHKHQQSLASSWVFNNSSPSAATAMDSPSTANTNTMSDVYRAPFGIRYNEHMSYEMDLNREHKKNSGGCCTGMVRLFVWSVIVVSLVGILASIAFIIYIEKIAPHTCCVDNINGTSSGRNGSAAIIPVMQVSPDHNGTTDDTTMLTPSAAVNVTTPQSYTLRTTLVTTLPPKISYTTVAKRITTTSTASTITTTEAETTHTTPDTAMIVNTTSQSLSTIAETPTTKSTAAKTTLNTELETKPRVLTINDSQTMATTSATTSPADNGKTDQMNDDTTTLASSSQPIITTTELLAEKSTVLNNRTADKEAVVTGDTMATASAHVVDVTIEARPINQKTGPETTTISGIATTAGSAADEREYTEEYYEEEPSDSVPVTPVTANTSESSGGFGFNNEYIRSFFG